MVLDSPFFVGLFLFSGKVFIYMCVVYFVLDQFLFVGELLGGLFLRWSL